MMPFFSGKTFYEFPILSLFVPLHRSISVKLQGSKYHLIPSAGNFSQPVYSCSQAVEQVSYDQREQIAWLLQAGFERKAIFLQKCTLGGTERKRAM